MLLNNFFFDLKQADKLVSISIGLTHQLLTLQVALPVVFYNYMHSPHKGTWERYTLPL